MPRATSSIKVACRSCHERRVKCDRSDGVSCSNCRQSRSHCEPIISRRGRRRKPFNIGPLSESSRSTSSETTSNELPCTNYHASGNRDPQHGLCYPALGPDGRTQYVGDSSNLNYLIQQFGNPFRNSLDHRPVEMQMQAAMLAHVGKSTEQEIEKHRSYTTDQLRQGGSFDLPPREISEALLDAYFHHSLPSLPVINKSRFLAALERGSASHLLLNSIYLVGTIFCSDSIIADSWFLSRYIASLTFYRRAKSLYDAGYEIDAIATIQATFLISHWWSGLLEPKDPWYWLGISVEMAHVLGMHQEKSYARLTEEDLKNWRILWWMVYAMDINLSMLQDRPPRVQGRLCNVKPLSKNDFEQVNDANMFAINAVQLARLVDQFYTIKYDGNNVLSQEECLQNISRWASTLPAELQIFSTKSSPWAIMTQLLYQEYRLLLLRNNPRFSQHTRQGTLTFEICEEISHMLEYIVANDLVFATAVSIAAPAFSTLTVHIINIQRGAFGLKMISENRARFCMVVLHMLQDRLPVIACFYPIYEILLRRYGVDVPVQNANVESGQTEIAPSADSVIHEYVDGCDASTLDAQYMSTTFPFSFPFGRLFEDVLMSSLPES